MKRRTFIKRTLGSLITASLFSAGTYYYAREIEPNRITISNFTISSNKVPQSFNHFKIVQFSDTHIGFHFHLNKIEKLINTINEQNPDLIVFTGDLIDQPNTFQKTNELGKLLKQLKAPYGKYWVYGNHDHGGYGTDLVKNIMKKAEFTLLKNEYTFIEKNNQKILLSGIDDVILGHPNLGQSLPDNYDGSHFTILLAHEPDYADVSAQFPIDIQLSGHSHGGQVRLPFLGHLYTPIFAEKYVLGKYMLRDESFLLYVNRGIGTTRLPFRMFCSPEISTYTLHSK